MIKSVGDPGFRSNEGIEGKINRNAINKRVGEHIKEFEKQFSFYFTAEYYILSRTRKRSKQKCLRQC